MKGNSKAGTIAVLVVVGLAIAYWKWIVGFAVVCLAVWGAYAGITAAGRRQRERAAVERAEKAAVAARAEEQHRQYLAGEDHGLYGDYRPAPLD